MSKFSELLSDYIHDKDIPVYALSRYCGLDRSSLYKILRGKRTPSSIFTVEQISEFIHLTPLEHEELLEAYQITLAGADNYYRRKYVMHFLTNFAENTSSIPMHYTITNFADNLPDIAALSGSSEIQHCLTSILLKETGVQKGQIHLLVQPDFTTVIHFLSHIRQSAATFSVTHILCMNSTSQITPSRKDYNLHCLQTILPLYSCDYPYESFYYYDNILSQSNAYHLFPYMILTSSHAVLLSSDYQKGLVFKQPEMVTFFHNIFQEYKASAKPLLKKVCDPFAMLACTGSILSESAGSDYSFQMTPCLSHLLPPSFLEKYLISDFIDRDTLLPLFWKHQQSLKKRYEKSKSVFIFSEDGVRKFLDTGRFVEYPKETYRPFEKHDCIFLIQQMLSLKDQFQYKMLKKSIGSIPYGANIFIGQNSGYLLFVNPESEENVFLNIEEPGLLFAFQDFFETMNDELFYPEEEMIKKLEDLLL